MVISPKLALVAAAAATSVTAAIVEAVPAFTEPSSVIIAAGTAAILAILAAISTATVKIIHALRSTTAIVAETQAINKTQNKKLDKITVLVDGRYSAVLQEMADLKLAVAKLSGLPADKVRAVDAQKRATEQAARVKMTEEEDEL